MRVRYEEYGKPAALGTEGLQRGTPYWRGGVAIVGERGPERVYLPRGTRVVPSFDSHDTIHIHNEAEGARYMHRRTMRQVAARSLM